MTTAIGHVELKHENRIVFSNGGYIDFDGKHLPEMEKPNWHYYMTDDGYLLHCRKEHMVYVISKVQDGVK